MTKSSKPNPTILSRLDEPTRQQAEGESVEVYRLRLQRQASKHLDRRCCAQVDAPTLLGVPQRRPKRYTKVR